MTKRAIVCGAGGFIGGHLVNRLVNENYEVIAIDIKPLVQWYQVNLDAINMQRDLRDPRAIDRIIRHEKPDELYQLAADMGGAGYIFSGDNDAAVMHNSAQINLNIAHSIANHCPSVRVFYSSSACIYPQTNQVDPNNPNCAEDTAYPANPDSEYGWEKLFSERLWLAYSRNHNISVRIARFHNIFGPFGSWDDGKEKAPAAVCRKIAEVDDGGTIEIWGDGEQTRSFLYVDECLEGVHKLMTSDCETILNIGSEEMVTINELVDITSKIADKSVGIKHISGPLGVRGRNSDNHLIQTELGWSPTRPLAEGLTKTYDWINNQVKGFKKTL